MGGGSAWWWDRALVPGDVDPHGDGLGARKARQLIEAGVEALIMPLSMESTRAPAGGRIAPGRGAWCFPLPSFDFSCPPSQRTVLSQQ